MEPNYEVTVESRRENTAAGPELYRPARHSTRAPLKRNMRVTLNLPVTLLDRMRNTVYWTPGLTLTELIKGAIQESVDRLERQQGKAFPTRLGELKSGRPRKRTSHRLSANTYSIMGTAPPPQRPSEPGYVVSSPS